MDVPCRRTGWCAGRVRPRRPGSPTLASRRVVAHTAGPLLVVGGPGTGKTTTLVEAVAARVAEGVDPAQILVLTFGRRARGALRDRIEARIGRPTGHRAGPEPVVRTFPAYAFGLLRLAAAERGEPAPRLLTGSEQDAVIRDLLDAPGDEAATGGWPVALRPAVRTRAFAAELRDLLLRAAERGIGAAQLAALGDQHGRADWVAAAGFLQEYVARAVPAGRAPGGSVAYDQAELVRAAAALLVDRRPARRRAGAGSARLRRRAGRHRPGPDRPARRWSPAAARTWSGWPTRTRPRSPSVAATRPGCATSPSGSRPRPGRRRPACCCPPRYRCGPELVAATRRVAARLRGPVRHRAGRCRPPRRRADRTRAGSRW